MPRQVGSEIDAPARSGEVGKRHSRFEFQAVAARLQQVFRRQYGRPRHVAGVTATPQRRKQTPATACASA